MQTEDDGLSRRERDDMRDQLIAGAERIRARSTRRGSLLAAGAALLVVGGIVGASITLALDGRNAAPVSTPTPTADLSAGISAFSASADGLAGADIFFVSSAMPPRRVLGEGIDAALACPAFSPDASKLAVGTSDSTLLVASVSEGGEVRATDEFALPFRVGQSPCPIWSPDGRWLATGVSRIARGWDYPSTYPYPADEVVVVDTTSGEVRRIDAAATDLEWAPDGTLYIANGGLRLYSLAADDLREVPLAGEIETFALSPDGTSLVAQRPVSAKATRLGWDLVIMGVDGSRQTVVVHDYAVDEATGPEWSPDGDHIAYLRVYDAYSGPRGGPPNYDEVAVLDVSRLADGGSSGEPVAVPPPVTDRGKRTYTWLPLGGVIWSPDGRSLRYPVQGYPSDHGGVHDGSITGYAESPIDGSSGTVLFEDGATVYSGTPWLALQSWPDTQLMQ